MKIAKYVMTALVHLNNLKNNVHFKWCLFLTTIEADYLPLESNVFPL